MSVQFAIFSSIDGIQDDLCEAVTSFVDGASGKVTEISLPCSGRNGWHVLVDDFELGEENIEIHAMGCCVGIFEPGSNELFVVPVDWVKPETLGCVRTMIVQVEEEHANKPFEKFVEKAYSKTFYSMGGIEMFRETLDDGAED